MIAQECLDAELSINPDCLLPRIDRALASVASCDAVKLYASEKSIEKLKQLIEQKYTERSLRLEFISERELGTF